jgi:predicted 2-oxoglutarate/Fe(II)-dependent dioxygenase YbiX
MKYEPGDVFSPHTDEYGERVWILGVQLSEETDYEGADFIFHNGNHQIDKTIGNCFTTKANLSHEVKKLVKGNRYSFVSFPDKTSLTSKKSLF